ncbi:hypothetical protein [Granulicoccus phenolivorans]|uniref:hypothetical protein n=1 Tax=Granulicoccus phenolivorans TaxID=266854 RepID=UPI0004061E57|nr:hypothetical protein [Granulicoccus phenolivorans]
MNELVVGYRNGELLRRVRRKEMLLGAIQLIPALLFGGLAILQLVTVGWAIALLFGVLAVFLLGYAVLIMVGAFTPAYAKAEAPNGVAWVLRRDGVIVNTASGPVQIPWAQVSITPTTLGRLPAITVGGPAGRTSWVTQYLTHNLPQLDAAARALSTPTLR